MLRSVLSRRIIPSFFQQRTWISGNKDQYSTCQVKTVHKTICFDPCLPNSLLIRCLSKPANVRHKTTETSNGRQLVYEGPLSRSVQIVKTISLSTTLATIVATPVIMIYGKAPLPLAEKVAVGAMICLAGSSTTFLLHWVTRVYIHRMFYNPETENFTVETMSLLARKRETEFGLNEIILAKEPTAFTTFQAKGKKYFLHTDLLEAQQVLQFVRKTHS